MLDLKVHSVTTWVKMSCSDALWAVLSGFEPYKTSDVGMFYDFLDKLWLEDKNFRVQTRFKLRSPSKKA